MGTRSYIGLKEKDESLIFVYCHWDGYVENNGDILVNHYESEEKVRELLKNGSFSALEPNSNQISYYANSENPSELEMYTFNDVDELKKDFKNDKWIGIEFFYIFDTDTNQWIVSNSYNDDLNFEKVTDVLNNL